MRTGTRPAPTLWASRALALLASVWLTGLLLTVAACTRTPEAPAKKASVALSAAPDAEALSKAWRRLAAPASESQWVWWEAEAPHAGNFPDHHPFQPVNDQERQALSAGNWIGHDGPGLGRFLEYQVQVPKTGRYEFYVRKFWAHGPFRWAFDGQPFRNCSKNVALLDSVTLRRHVSANWVNLGEVELTSGAHRLRLELTDEQGAAAFDAFVLSSGEFVPRGSLKPNVAQAPAEAGWSVFDPAADNLQPSILDLRHLNLAHAGAEGPVVAKGSELVFRDSQRATRFWGVNVGAEALFLAPRDQRRLAQTLSKRGVNLVRIHAPFFEAGQVHKPDLARLDALPKLAAALHEFGIHIGLSTYFPVWTPLREEDGFPGYKGEPSFGIVYFDSKLQQAQRQWLKHVLETPGPNGVPLGRDPALAFVELVNEDSLLFWTFRPYEAPPQPQTLELERRFGVWLTQQYGSLANAFSHWNAEPVRGDDEAAGRAGFLPLWDLTQKATPRAQDSARFLAVTMRDYYAQLAQTLRNELGYTGLTVCSNWHTADERVLGPLDNWANLACDVMDRHAYLAGPHTGPASEYALDAGQTFDDRSALRVRSAEHSAVFEFLEPRYNGRPAFVSELGWPSPNRFRGEGPLLVAAYGRLTGLDAPMWFATSKPRWTAELGKFDIADPATLGQFPAASLLFREGLVQEVNAVARAALSDSDLFALKGAPLWPVAGLDPLRRAPGALLDFSTAKIDPLALLVGPVDFELGSAKSEPTLQDLTSFIQRHAGYVQSRGGELTWDFERGSLLIRTPQVQAALGFLAAGGKLELPSFTSNLHNEYASVVLVSLDKQPLERARSMLLQVFTEVKSSGFAAPGEGPRAIQSTGAAPLLVRNVQGDVSLQRPDADALRVVALDVNGQPHSEALQGAARIPLLPDVQYYWIAAQNLEPRQHPNPPAVPTP